MGGIGVQLMRLGVRTYVSVVEDDERVLRMLGCDDGNAHAETYVPSIGMYSRKKCEILCVDGKVVLRFSEDRVRLMWRSSLFDVDE